MKIILEIYVKSFFIMTVFFYTEGIMSGTCKHVPPLKGKESNQLCQPDHSSWSEITNLTILHDHRSPTWPSFMITDHQPDHPSWSQITNLTILHDHRSPTWPSFMITNLTILHDHRLPAWPSFMITNLTILHDHRSRTWPSFMITDHQPDHPSWSQITNLTILHDQR